jgi:type VI secretion system protein ImpL
VPPPDPNLAQSAAALVGQVGEAVAAQSSSLNRLGEIVGGAQAQSPQEAPGMEVERRFANLHRLTEGADTGPTLLDGIIRSLDDLYQQLNRLSLGSGSSSDISGATAEAAQLQRATQMLASTASRLPEPAAGWLSAVAKSSTSITVGGARQQVRQKLNAAWNSQVLPSCRQAIEGRYPIYKDSNIEVGLNDFGRIFGPGGQLDEFFNVYLRPFVDSSRMPWRWQSVDNINLGIPDSVLVQFQRAAVIRDSLFLAGGQMPGLNFEVIPVNLGPTATQVVLDIDGQNLIYRHGPQRFTRMSWPGPGGRGEVRLAFGPLIPGEPSSETREGPWAWFRMLDAGRIMASDRPDRFDVTFQVGSRAATFGLRANTVVNPFTLPELGQFRCPPSL